MIQVKVNGILLPLMRKVLVVDTVEVTHVSMVPMPIPEAHTRPVLEWIYDLTQRAEGPITYNGTVLEKDIIKSPEAIIQDM